MLFMKIYRKHRVWQWMFFMINLAYFIDYSWTDHAPVKTFKLDGIKPNPYIPDKIHSPTKTREGKEITRPYSLAYLSRSKAGTKARNKGCWERIICWSDSEISQTIPTIFGNVPAMYRYIHKTKINTKDDKFIAEDSDRFFVSVGQSTVDKIQSLANESDLTVNANYFVPRRMSDNSPQRQFYPL